MRLEHFVAAALCTAAVSTTVNLARDYFSPRLGVCVRTPVGCRDWSEVGHKCTDIFAKHTKVYIAHSWSCVGNTVQGGSEHCHEIMGAEDDCCLDSNLISCAQDLRDFPAKCPCPPFP